MTVVSRFSTTARESTGDTVEFQAFVISPPHGLDGPVRAVTERVLYCFCRVVRSRESESPGLICAGLDRFPVASKSILGPKRFSQTRAPADGHPGSPRFLLRSPGSADL